MILGSHTRDDGYSNVLDINAVSTGKRLTDVLKERSAFISRACQSFKSELLHHEDEGNTLL